jgi:hypothetical protein
VRASLIAGLWLLGVGACDRPLPSAKPWVPEATTPSDSIVALVGEVPIFAAEVAAQAARSEQTPRAALDELIGLHLLAERLRPNWPPDDPTARQLRREMYVQRLLERDFEATSRIEDMPDAVVQVIYDRSIDGFVHPRLVEVAVLGITPGKKATPEIRAQARKTINELKAIVDLRRDKTAEDLQAAIADDKWRQRGVQFFRFIQAGNKPYTAKFGAEVAKLKAPGETSAVIEDEFGVYIARYLSERPAANQTFEQVKKGLREAYYPRWRQARFLEFADHIAATHEVEVHAGALPASPGS